MRKSLTSLAIMVPLLATSVAGLRAQTFVPPHAEEYTYGDPHMIRPQTTSCYSLDEAYTWLSGGVTGDLYVAGWGTPVPGEFSEVTWLLTDHASPSSVTLHGNIPYYDVADMEVGSIRNAGTNTTNILVAYYRNGVGHFLDVYDIVGGTATMVNSVQLSYASTYGRIRIDCHSVYEAAVAWDCPGVGIQTIASNNGSWNPANISTLNGTTGESVPDIAFCTDASTNVTNLHYVYYNRTTGFVTEAAVDLSTLLGAPGLITPTIGDYNYVDTSLQFRPVLDCPDFYNTDSWAYTYAYGMDVYVRHVDYSTMAMPATTSVTSGIWGNVAITGMYHMMAPTLNYGSGAIGSGTDQITVGWYITDAAGTNKYIALQMSSDGSSLLSSSDYLDLPHAATSYGYPYAGIAFSKSDVKSAPVFLYSTYYDYDNANDVYQLHHAFHKWGDVSFKGQGTTGITAREAAAGKLSSYPSPFTNSFTARIALQQDGVVHLDLYDLTGRLVGQQESTLSRGEHQVKMDHLEKLAPGTYILKASLNQEKIGTKMITKQ